MSEFPRPPNEHERLEALRRYDILDTAPEEAFDRVTELAVEILGFPLAVINFIDRDRQWGKSCVGIEDSEAPRTDSFCAWTILGEDVMVVPNAKEDPRFTSNPMVVGPPQVHLYAGAPLTTPDGHRIGTLCVTDDQPREFTDRDARILKRLACMVVDELELRQRTRELERELREKAVLIQELQAANAQAETLAAVSALTECSLEPEATARAVAELLGQVVSVDWAGLIIEKDGERQTFTASHVPDTTQAFLSAASGLGSRPNSITWQVTRSGTPLFLDDYLQHPHAFPTLINAGVRSAAWLPLGEYDGAKVTLKVVRLHQARAWTDRERTLLAMAARSVLVSFERREHQRLMQAAALTDHLTGLINRRGFDADLARCCASHMSFQLALIDLNGFKRVNDVEGHARGDVLLQLFASELRAMFRPYDGVYRVGGDEFALLLPISATSLQPGDVLDRVEQVVKAVQKLGFGGMGASVGVAVTPDDGEDGETLLHLADERMYHMKRARTLAT